MLSYFLANAILTGWHSFTPVSLLAIVRKVSERNFPNPQALEFLEKKN